jgi:formate hydrogenlyase subunit 3/multisubunit Na+/H+ antiporter MnhD subunit
VTGTQCLLVATVAAPLGLLAACLSEAARRRMPGLLWLAPLPGLAAALLAADGPPLVLDEARLRFTLALDAPAALLLGVAALLWSAAGAYAFGYLGAKPGAGRFAVWWLLTLSGSLGVFIAGDLGTFYLAFAAVSLAACGLVVHDRTDRARRAGGIYLLLAVLGEVCLLLAFALLADATPGPSIAIADVVAALPGAPSRGLMVALLVAGFGLKAGLVPLHVWLPLAHPVAPMPASAVLSGAIIKAGVIGLVRFLPVDGRWRIGASCSARSAW